jgi:hypothetical protein
MNLFKLTFGNKEQVFDWARITKLARYFGISISWKEVSEDEFNHKRYGLNNT